MKLYVLFGNLILGVIGYIIVEIRHRRKVNIWLSTLNLIDFFKLNLIFIDLAQQERRLKKQEQKEKAAREAEAAKQDIEETDDEKDDLEEDIEVTHF